MTCRQAQSQKDFLNKLGILSFSQNITLPFLEGTAHLIYCTRSNQVEQSNLLVLYQQDGTLGWSHILNSEFTTTTEAGDVLLDINDHRLQDNPYFYKKPLIRSAAGFYTSKKTTNRIGSAANPFTSNHRSVENHHLRPDKKIERTEIRREIETL